MRLELTENELYGLTKVLDFYWQKKYTHGPSSDADYTLIRALRAKFHEEHVLRLHQKAKEEYGRCSNR